MAEVDINGSCLGNALAEMLTAPDIEPGDQPSYELAKVIWLFHPLGKKMVEGPMAMAQSQKRIITVTDGPEDACRDAFNKQWEADHLDDVTYNVVAVSRAYGIGSIALACRSVPPNVPIDPKKLADLEIAFSVYDPLNTAGSLVLNQDPNSLDFMKVTGIAVSGIPYHRSRTVTLMNERPVYIAYTSSAFGFVGRSVFQRALFPLKSFVQTMITDDLVTKKAGVFIMKLSTAGSIIDNIMQASAAMKRWFVKASTNGNVISIGKDEEVNTLNMQNIDGAFGNSRKNILENIATAADMPAIILKQETFAEGFGEGTEDAKMVAGYIEAFRQKIKPVYDFLDPICQRRAWTPEWYATIQTKHPEWKSVPYEEAFFRFATSFGAAWPNLLTEPDSEKVKVDETKLKSILEAIEIFGPMLDPENKATLIQWAQDNMNENDIMFQAPLLLDIEKLKDYVPPQQQMMAEGEPKEPKPFSALDSAGPRRRRGRRLNDEELHDLVTLAGSTLKSLPKPNGHINGSARHG